MTVEKADLATAALAVPHPGEGPGRWAQRSVEDDLAARALRAAGRALARNDLVRADGECSVRLDTGDFLISPDMPLGLVAVDTPCLRLGRTGPIPASAPASASLHRAIYAARDDVRAIIRAMPPALTSPVSDAPALTDVDALVAALGNGASLALGLRGHLVVGRSIEDAFALLWQSTEAARLHVATGATGALPGVASPDDRTVARIWQYCTAGDSEHPVDPPAVAPGRRVPEPEPEDFDYWRSPGHLLRRCTQRAHDIFHEVLAGQITVTRQQFVVLWAVRDNPEASQQRLSQVTGWDRNTMAGMLARLQEQGLIARQRDASDGRLYRIHLTEQGQAMLRDMVPGLLEVRRRVLEPLPPAAREIFVQYARVMLGLAADS